MSKRLNIGVTGPDKGGTAAWWFTRFALFLQGARAIRIHPNEGLPEAEIHGLIIGGGADINPQRYGGSEIKDLFSKDQKVSDIRHFFYQLASLFFFPFIYLIRKLFSTSTPSELDNERDELEFKLLARALEEGIPVLGICRGAQLLNIHFGGTLYRDISNFYSEVPQVMSVWPKKKIRVEEGSKLHKALDFSKVWVNALHHQAVDEIGEQLKVVAREESGIIQAIEYQGDQFVIGVQWHPEYMPQISPQRRIFKELVDCAKQYAGHKKT